jgi:dTDP-4-amino-4,6-dideoxygalactose transaminase
MSLEASFLVPAQPRPTWRHLVGPPTANPVPARISARVEPVFWGRSALFHGVRALGLRPGDAVLVPAFHCASVIEPILRAGLQVEFFRVGRDGSPDLEDVKRRIDARTRALLVIHYFGFPQPIRELHRLAVAHGLFLIEDCAHVLLGHLEGEPLGGWGDIAVFSWRKFLPLYDGGYLVVNDPRLPLPVRWERETVLLKLKILYNVLGRLVDLPAGLTARLGRVSTALTALGRSLLAGVGDARALAVRNWGTDFDSSAANLRMSSVSRHVLSRLDLHAIVERRRLNFLHLLRATRWLPGLAPLVEDLPDGACPLAFPVIAETRDFHLELRSRGIPAVTWAGVVHPDFPSASFPDADFLFHHLVLLPIHQDLHDTHLETIVRVLESAALGSR